MDRVIEVRLRIRTTEEDDQLNEIANAIGDLAEDELGFEPDNILSSYWVVVEGDEDKEDEEFTDDLLH